MRHSEHQDPDTDPKLFGDAGSGYNIKYGYDLCPVTKVQKKPLIGTKKRRRLLPTFTADMEGL